MTVWTVDGKMHTFDPMAEVERIDDELHIFTTEVIGRPRRVKAIFPVVNVVRWDP